MDGFESIVEGEGYTVVEGEDNEFTVTGPIPDPEEVGGTGFFEALAEQGIETITVNGTAYMISDEGVVAEGAAAARAAIFEEVVGDQSVDITVDIPYGDGTTTTPVTYTFNFVIDLG